MKRFVLFLVLCTIMPAQAGWGIDHAVVGSLGYGIRGPEETNVTWGMVSVAGKLADLKPDKSISLWASGKYDRALEYLEVGGPGAEAYVVCKTRWDHVYAILGGGWLSNVAEKESEVDLQAGATYKLGMVVDVSDDAFAIFMLEAVDRGELNHVVNLHFGIGVHNLFGMLVSQ